MFLHLSGTVRLGDCLVVDHLADDLAFDHLSIHRGSVVRVRRCSVTTSAEQRATRLAVLQEDDLR